VSEDHGHKTRCLAWWVFPTDWPGKNEPEPQALVTALTAREFAQRAPRLCRQCLEKAVQLARDGHSNPPLGGVLGPEDMGRMKRFIQFWRSADRAPGWLPEVLAGLAHACSSAHSNDEKLSRDADVSGSQRRQGLGGALNAALLASWGGRTARARRRTGQGTAQGGARGEAGADGGRRLNCQA